MILEKGECVVVKNSVQRRHMLEMLIEHGYKFHHGASLTSASEYVCGARYWHGGEYPNCIATMDSQLVQDAKSGRRLDSGWGPYVVLSYEEFVERRYVADTKVEVDDLL